MIVKTPCPCESGLDYSNCCEPCLQGEKPATTAEALMRSRYTAYVNEDEDYLRSSWHPSTRPRAVSFTDNQRWLGLKIRQTIDGGESDTTGEVEFVARFKIDGQGHRLHERSRFVKEAGQWLYVDGDLK